MHLLDLIAKQFSNQFVGGGLVLMFTGSVLALLRATPRKCVAWLKRRLTVEVEVLNSDPLFDYVTAWLDAQPYSKRSRKLTATITSRTNDAADSSPSTGERPLPRVFLSPAPGVHVFLYCRNIIWLERTRDSSPGAAGHGGPVASLLKHESYILTILGRNQSALRLLVDEVIRFGTRPSECVRLFNSSFGYWHSSGLIRPRKLDSVVLPAGVAEMVLADAKHFLASNDWYHSVGIPWHRGYLLYGLPGTGKTSLVSALAGELRMDLYLLNLSGMGMDDDRLCSLMANVRSGTMVLMEDIDCTVPDRDSVKEGHRVTLSGLLNCLDGVQSREGCMIFMTTNFRETLDSALTRPGRVDVALDFGLATEEQILRLSKRLAPERNREALLRVCTGMTMAEVQQTLLREHTALGLQNSRTLAVGASGH